MPWIFLIKLQIESNLLEGIQHDTRVLIIPFHFELSHVVVDNL